MGIPRYDNFENLKAYIEVRAAKLAMVIDPDAKLEDIAPWHMLNGIIMRAVKNALGKLVPDGLFFKIPLVKILRAAGREVPNWGQPMFQELGGTGYVAVFYTEIDGVLYLLLRVKGEPGTLGIKNDDGVNTRVAVTPTVQFSAGNLKAHGDKVPFSNITTGRNVSWWNIVFDPGRFLEKVNKVAAIPVTTEEAAQEVGENPDFVWVSSSQLEKLGQLGWLTNFVLECVARIPR